MAISCHDSDIRMTRGDPLLVTLDDGVGDTRRVLEMRPSCECCDRDLPADSSYARICSFECTWCADCADRCLGGVCPNCGGGFTPRPTRPADALAADPASTTRVHQPGLHLG